MKSIPFDRIARLPVAGDNAAIAVRRLEAGTPVRGEGGAYRLSHTLLEGHRFAVAPIPAGGALLSWGLPFGVALQPVQPGDYLANAAVLEALQARTLDASLPATPNFADRILEFELDPNRFCPSDPLPQLEDGLTFMGYARPDGRGVGTRNTILLLGLSSYTNGFVRRLQAHLQERCKGIPNLDGIAPVAHTEGEQENADQHAKALRALAGFVVHPNVAAALVVSHPGSALTWEVLRDWMAAQGYPLAQVPHAHLALSGDFEADLARGEEMVQAWLPQVAAGARSPQPLSGLKIALQCGGSDAFSGISGNPLAALASREVLRRGGTALLAETPELVGAEAYVLANVRSLAAAQQFLAVQARFKAQVGAYGVSVEGNISAGNRYRGLYNITLKSIGAARKRHPEVPLDGVLDYAERLDAPGYYFMDSPGNDLESIAGQVAAGCNLVVFVTGNGSVTNFPFVPTLKVVTTTGRYKLMPDEMDVNAGRYLDGEPLDALGDEAFALFLAAAGGQPTAGEQAGHSQVHLWRADPPGKGRVERLEQAGPTMQFPEPELRIAVDLCRTANGFAAEQVGLILPGSLCSAQVARLFAEKLTRQGLCREAGISRFVALAHTEGCGSSGNTDDMLVRTLAGYLHSPLAACAVVLEHGCERTVNDVLQRRFAALGLDPATVGWASVQMDGGLKGALAKIERWFRDWAATRQPPPKVRAGLEAVHLGLLVHGQLSESACAALAALAGAVASGGGRVISALPLPGVAPLSLPELPPGPGLHHLRLPTAHWTETHAALGALGLNVLLGWTDRPLPGHPLLPLLQVGEGHVSGLDLALTGDPVAWAGQMLAKIAAVLSGAFVPLALQQGDVDFQLTRGEMGVSL